MHLIMDVKLKQVAMFEITLTDLKTADHVMSMMQHIRSEGTIEVIVCESMHHHNVT